MRASRMFHCACSIVFCIHTHICSHALVTFIYEQNYSCCSFSTSFVRLCATGWCAEIMQWLVNRKARTFNVLDIIYIIFVFILLSSHLIILFFFFASTGSSSFRSSSVTAFRSFNCYLLLFVRYISFKSVIRYSTIVLLSLTLFLPLSRTHTHYLSRSVLDDVIWRRLIDSHLLVGCSMLKKFNRFAVQKLQSAEWQWIECNGKTHRKHLGLTKYDHTYTEHAHSNYGIKSTVQEFEFGRLSVSFNSSTYLLFSIVFR